MGAAERSGSVAGPSADGMFAQAEQQIPPAPLLQRGEVSGGVSSLPRTFVAGDRDAIIHKPLPFPPLQKGGRGDLLLLSPLLSTAEHPQGLAA